jgi:transcription elongation GreA/GreB family factor
MDLSYRDLNALLERSRGEERAYVSQIIRPMREQLDAAEAASRHVKRMLSQKTRQGTGGGGGGGAGGGAG